MIVTVHTAVGLVALVAGAWNLAATKGTRRHRVVGWAYAGSMATLLLTSFAIFEVFGSFGAFHVMSLVSGGTLAMAVYCPLRRKSRPVWLEEHYMWISYSYLGLLMATGSHFFDYLPGWPFWPRAAMFWGLPFAIGSALVFGQKRRVLDQVDQRLHSSDAT